METAQHVAALEREGLLLAAVAARTDLDAAIPTCPEWTMRDLLHHVGDVHRWAAAHVAERRTAPIRRAEEVAGSLPPDGEILEWFRAGHAHLVETLQAADPDLECWTFLPAPSPVAFWARRQAHETGMHRADAESPGGSFTPFPPEFAIDGIDEMLFGFLGRNPLEATLERTRTIHLCATDADGEWLVQIGPEGVTARRDHAEADCSARGTASDLHLLVSNRRSAEDPALEVAGDASLLSAWRERVKLTWSRGR